MTVRNRADVARVIAQIRQTAVAGGMASSRVAQLATAVSEIATNTIKYADGGTVDICALPSERHPHRSGLRGPVLEVTVNDDGPGIEDVDTALTDHFTTGTSLGLGMSGAGRLVDDMVVDSELGRGTRVVLRKWM